MSTRMKKFISSIAAFKFEFVIYLILTALATYPLFFNLSTMIYGGREDSMGSLYFFWRTKHAFDGFDISTLLSYPFGFVVPLPMPRVLDWGIAALAYTSDLIISYNIFTLMGFILSAVGAYQLTYYFTKNRYASFIAGAIFAFSPFHLSQAEHLNINNTQWIPFFVLYLFRLKDDVSYKNGIMCSIFFSLIVLSEYYYAVFMSVFFIFFAAAVLLSKYDIKSIAKLRLSKSYFTSHTFKVILTSSILASFIIVAAYYSLIATLISMAFFSGSAANLGSIASPRLQFAILYDFVVHSAHWWNFVFPSNQHPVFGKYALDFIKTNMPGFLTGGETNLYIGYTSLLLSIFAIKKRKDFPARFFALAAVIAVLFSTGPFMQFIPLYGIPIPYLLIIPMVYAFYKKMNKLGWFLLISSVFTASLPFWLYDIVPSLAIMNTFQILPIPMPAILIFLVTPMIRVMARFDVIVMLSVSVLAGMGVSLILERIKSNKKQIRLVLVIILLIGFEYTNIPPWRATYIGDVPEVYTWLASQPDDVIIAEYPFYSSIFYQRIHGKRMINGPAFETLKFTPMVEHLTNPGVPSMLRYLGADYVIFNEHDFEEQYGTMPELNKTVGLLFLKKVENISVYKITAEPGWIEPVVYDAGFYPPETRPSGRLGRWMINNGTVTLINYSPEKRQVNINFSAVSFGKDRTLEIMLNNKHVETIDLTNIRKGFTLKDMELYPGNNTLIFHSLQEPVTVDSVVHNGDMRKYSADFSNIVVEYR